MKYLLVIFLWLPMLVYADDNMSRALVAFKAANYTLAEQFWMYAAGQGDAVAQYNLAYLYHNGIGVDSNDEKSRRLLRTAAQSNLVDAYNKVLDDAVQPATVEDGLEAIAVTDPQIWVKTQEGKNYTLQLASSRSQELIEKYFSDNALEGKAGYYKSKRQGEYWYALVYGSYKSVSDANEAIAGLPKDLRKWSPWVRRLDSIQKITSP